MSTLPELLSPAGDWECVRAAVSNGADAVYFGLPRFNARMRADNFTEDELPKVVDFLHRHGVKAYVALNVLIFTDELPDALAQLQLLEASGVDAVIIQDVGLASMARELTPRLRLHASTQMTVTSPEGAAFAESLGVSQIVLARELSLREIRRFEASHVPLEVFVHGALCVAYSGQCLTSESLGQRSANRGECAQACRMPYELIVDGQTMDLGDRRYLLSPQDLAAVAEIPALVEAGVRSFKIEGRLKTPEYVAGVTAVYRRALDAAIAGGKFQASLDDWYRLEMTFSRGLYSGWMHGVNHQELVGARHGKKRGHFLGRVARIGSDFVDLEAAPNTRPAKPGDGIVFENPTDTNAEEGGRVFAIQGTRLVFGRGHLNLNRIRIGTGVWKTDDPALSRELRQSFAADPQARPGRRRALDVVVTGKPGQPLRIEFQSGGHLVSVQSQELIAVAENQPLTSEKLLGQLGKLGGTLFELGKFENRMDGPGILPLSALNRLRREAVHLLEAKISEPPAVGNLRTLPELLSDAARLPSGDGSVPELVVLARDDNQALAAITARADALYLDYEDVRRYAAAVERLRETPGCPAIFLATPRIQKSGEQGFFRLIENAKPDGVLIRNLGALDHFSDSPLRRVGDFSLNVANPLAAAVFLRDHVERVTASYDLTAGQVIALASALPAGRVELTLHQHMPMFHMEHCVFAAFMSNGKDYTDCGRPCEKHRVHLRDRVGIEHPLRADVGCRNTLFNAAPQTGAKFFQSFVQAGIHHFRVELLEENSEESETIVRAYRRLLDGDEDGEFLWRKLKAIPQLGVTQGTL